MGRRPANPDELTSIKGGESDPFEEKETPKKKKKGKAPTFTETELAEKTFFICRVVAGLFKFEWTYKEKDFSSEGQALARMCDKFPVVGTAITFFDPLYYIGSILNKFSGLKSKKATEAQKEEPKTENVYPMANRG